MKHPVQVIPSRFVDGTRAEQVRIRAATRDGKPCVQVALLEPLTSHSSAMSVVGRPIMVPVANITALIEALYAAKVDADATPPEPPQAKGGEF